MSDNNNIGQRVNAVLNSMDGAQRATANPYLYTRIQAALHRQPDTYWERLGRLMARPSIAIAGIVVVIALNLAVVISHTNKADALEEMTLNTDDFYESVAIVYDIDNNEP
jgi:uncharacterized membrane protein YdfJ with MMPL/SSD domain